MQPGIGALDHRVAGERVHDLCSAHREQLDSAGAGKGDAPPGTAVLRHEDAALAAVRLLAGPVVLGQQAVPRVEERNRHRLKAWIPISIAGSSSRRQDDCSEQTRDRGAPQRMCAGARAKAYAGQQRAHRRVVQRQAP